MTRRPWTPEELTHLLSQYPNTPTKDIARTLDRPIASVYQKAQNLGLKKSQAFLNSPIPDTYTQYGPEAAEILWKQHQLIAGLERDNDRLRAEVEALRKAILDAIAGQPYLPTEVEPMLHDLSHALRGEGE